MEKNLANIDELAITPLSDEELNSVSGAAADVSTANSCICCSSGATTIKTDTVATQG
ncbi:hypothetical protein G4177_15105 [Corallococcus sp. ZKHCc1 1396]|uniref:Thiazolylpeptide-type bacteriocin n=1 Tax=Corallococcus soli TaxID=2710757 RepID=A0ABR9PNJ5_9BACT|nr:hypothetical protein [Corallococcus soli]MBE4749492.1 hypothetical protein [Corallococcus soli]